MKATSETYEKVAENCSSFEPIAKNDSYSNKAGEDCHISCKTCTHFDTQNHCDLDLYDEIVNQHKF